MKKTLQSILVVIIIIATIGLLGNYEHTYTREATVTSRQGVKVCAVDKQGNEWNYTVTRDDKTKQGDTVILTMHDNATDSVLEDDKVVDAKVKA